MSNNIAPIFLGLGLILGIAGLINHYVINFTNSISHVSLVIIALALALEIVGISRFVAKQKA